MHISITSSALEERGSFLIAFSLFSKHFRKNMSVFQHTSNFSWRPILFDYPISILASNCYFPVLTFGFVVKVFYFPVPDIDELVFGTPGSVLELDIPGTEVVSTPRIKKKKSIKKYQQKISLYGPQEERFLPVLTTIYGTSDGSETIRFDPAFTLAPWFWEESLYLRYRPSAWPWVKSSEHLQHLALQIKHPNGIIYLEQISEHPEIQTYSLKWKD